MDMKQCYLCGGTEFNKRPGSVRDNPELEVLECASCGLVFLSSFDHIRDGFYENSEMPTVNVGSRQNGRLRSTNVIDTKYDKKEIKLALEKCLFDKTFRDSIKNCPNPYGTGNSGNKIAKVLAEVSIDQKLLRKRITY